MNKSYGAISRPATPINVVRDRIGSRRCPSPLVHSSAIVAVALGGGCGAAHPAARPVSTPGGGPGGTRHEQHPAFGLRRFGELRPLPRGHLRGVAEFADAPHDAAAGRGPHPCAFRPGTAFHFKDDTARLSSKDGARFVRLTSPRAATTCTGSPASSAAAYREDFAGVEVAAEAADAPRVLRPGGAPTRSCCFPSPTCSRPGASASRATPCWSASGRGCARAASGTRPASSATTRRRTSTAPGASSSAGARPATRARSSTGCFRTTGAGVSSCAGTASGRGSSSSSTRSRPRWPPSAAIADRGGGDRRAALAGGIGELRAHFGARQLRGGRDRLRGLPRRRPRARGRSEGAPRLRAAQRLPGGAARGGARR